MFLKKKLLTIPIRNQYEPLCNAAVLKEMGIRVITSLKGWENKIWEGLEGDAVIGLNEIADPDHIISSLVRDCFSSSASSEKSLPVT